MYVITGATGHTGSAAARTLLQAGQRVRIVARNREKAQPLLDLGAELFEADLEDAAALTRAFSGAAGVYLISPPDVRSENFVAQRMRTAETFRAALEAARPSHVVFLSSIGAQHATGTGPIVSVHFGESILGASGVPLTFLRASYFVENWGAVLPAVTSDGVLPSFIPADLAIPMVATQDIGHHAAQALLTGARGRRILELSGPQDKSPRDVARALSDILNRPIQVAELPPAAAIDTFTRFGASPHVAGLFQEMYTGIANGRVSFAGPPAERVHGSTPLEQTLRALLGC